MISADDSAAVVHDAKKRRVTPREARTLQRVLRTAERAAIAPIGVVAINAITAVPTVLLHADAVPVEDSLWEALVAAEDAPTPLAAVRAVGSAAPVQRFETLAEAMSWTAPLATQPEARVEPTVEPARSRLSAIDAVPAVPEDDVYCVRQWPRVIRTRSFAVCMPAADRRRLGRCCVFWMIATPRLQFNLALKLALLMADRLHMPLLVVAQVGSLATVSSSLAALLRELWLGLAERGVAMVIGETSTPAVSMATLLRAVDAHVCVADEPLDPLMRRWLVECGDALRGSPERHCALYAIATNTLAAPRYTSPLQCDAAWYADALAEYAQFDASLPAAYRPSVPSDAAWLAQVRGAAAAAGVALRDGAALPGAGFVTVENGESEWRTVSLGAMQNLTRHCDVDGLHFAAICNMLRTCVRLGAVSAVELALALDGIRRAVTPAQYAELSAVVGREREQRTLEQWQTAQQR